MTKSYILIICFFDHKSKLASPAEYNAAVPIKTNINIIKINSRLILFNLDIFIIFLFPLNNQMLNTIREYIYVNLKKEFMNHGNVSIYYPEDKTEIDMLDDFASVHYLLYLH